MIVEPNPDSAADIQAFVRETMAWGVFHAALRHKNRYVPHDEGYAHQLIDELLQTKIVLAARSDLFRARKLPAERAATLRAFRSDEMGAPPLGKGGGRLNPDGVPCLYAAGDVQTAIAEVRPWKRAALSVARLTTQRDVQIVDIASVAEENSATARLRAFAQVVSTPVHDRDALSYVGTQYVAQRLRHEGIAGVKYPSALRETGVNFALFDPSDAVVQEVVLHEVHSVTYGSGVVSQARIEFARLFTPA
jgi:RES domain-containing protein